MAPTSAATAAVTTAAATAAVTTAEVVDFYKEALQNNGDNFKLSAVSCSSSQRITPYLAEKMKLLPKAVRDASFGCSAPIPLGIQGKTVLDLGSGAGRDCYLAAIEVGKEGKVIGADMGDEMLQHARAHVDEFATTLTYRPNLEFKKCNIEDLSSAGIEQNSVDVCISNCVVNLTENKRNVLRSVYVTLKEGGEMYFGDLYADRRVPPWAAKDKQLVGEGFGGSLYYRDFERMAKEVGFSCVRVMTAHIHPCTEETSKRLNNAKFISVTYRLFKCDKIEDTAELYGDTATYKGTMPGAEGEYTFDAKHTFVKDKPLTIDGQTAGLISKSWLSSHFQTDRQSFENDNTQKHMGPAYVATDPLALALALPTANVTSCCSAAPKAV